MTSTKDQQGERKYVLSLGGCSRFCKLNPENSPTGLSDSVHRWFEAGDTVTAVQEKLADAGYRLAVSTVARHRAKHLHVVSPDSPDYIDHADALTELDIIDRMIQAGGRQVGLSTTKISAEQLLRAIELKHKLTEGSVFDNLFAAMQKSANLDLDDVPDSDANPAVASEDERRQGAANEA